METTGQERRHAPNGVAGLEDALHGEPAVQRLLEENAVLATELRDARAEIAVRGAELGRAREQAAALRGEAQRLAQQCAAVEELRSDLAKLHVAATALHGTLDPDGVLDALEEVVINLVGSECFGIFAYDEATLTFTCLRAFGYDPDHEGLPTLGVGRVGQTIRSGRPYLRASEESEGPAACVPLRAGDATVGVLVVYELLPQKAELTHFDVDLFDLVTVHAGAALHAAWLHTAARAPGEAAA